MIKLNVYAMRDTLVGDSSLILTAKNDAVLKRNLKGVMLSQQQNPINTDTKDKCIYQIGELDCDEGKLVALSQPVYVCGLEEIRLDAISDITKAQQQAKELGVNDANKDSE